MESDVSGYRDDLFREFRRFCAEIVEENFYLVKIKFVYDFINKGFFGGKIYLYIWIEKYILNWYLKCYLIIRNNKNNVWYNNLLCCFL